MKLPDLNPKNLFAVAILLLGAITVVAGVALIAGSNSRPQVVPSVTPTTIDDTDSSSPTAPPTLTSPSKSSDNSSNCLISTSGMVKCPGKPSFCSDGAPCQPKQTAPSDRSTCPVTTDGYTKCPEDPYCPGGEGCETGPGQPWDEPSPGMSYEGDLDWTGNVNQ